MKISTYQALDNGVDDEERLFLQTKLASQQQQSFQPEIRPVTPLAPRFNLYRRVSWLVPVIPKRRIFLRQLWKQIPKGLEVPV